MRHCSRRAPRRQPRLYFLIIPLILIYLRYYGRAVTLRLVALMFAAMAAAALVVDAIFSAADIIPSTRPSIESITGRSIEWNYTTFLNIVFFVVAGCSSRSPSAAARATPSAA